VSQAFPSQRSNSAVTFNVLQKLSEKGVEDVKIGEKEKIQVLWRLKDFLPQYST